jgi:hypothetical protein
LQFLNWQGIQEYPYYTPVSSGLSIEALHVERTGCNGLTLPNKDLHKGPLSIVPPRLGNIFTLTNTCLPPNDVSLYRATISVEEGPEISQIKVKTVSENHCITAQSA